MIWYDDAQVVDLSGPTVGAWLADRPCNIKGKKDFLMPSKAMLELLGNWSFNIKTPVIFIMLFSYSPPRVNLAGSNRRCSSSRERSQFSSATSITGRPSL